jgi:hypothetical protein
MSAEYPGYRRAKIVPVAGAGLASRCTKQDADAEGEAPYLKVGFCQVAMLKE